MQHVVMQRLVGLCSYRLQRKRVLGENNQRSILQAGMCSPELQTCRCSTKCSVKNKRPFVFEDSTCPVERGMCRCSAECSPQNKRPFVFGSARVHLGETCPGVQPSAMAQNK